MKLRKTMAIGLAFLTSSHSHAQWQDLTSNVPGTLTTTNVGPMLSTGSELYVLGNVGIFRSLDGGTTFTALNSVSGGASYDLSATDLRFVEKAGNFIYVGTSPASGAFNVGYTAMHRLEPGETSWQQASQVFLPDTVFGDTVDDIAFDPASGTYFAASGLAGCYVSSDGLTWSEKRNGLPTYVSPGPIGEFSNGNSLVVKNGKTFIGMLTPFAAGIYASTDLGENWSFSGAASGSVGTLAQHGNRIIAATAGATLAEDGLHFSDDDGATWQYRPFLGNEFDIRSNGTLLTAGFNSQLKFSATEGDTWDDLDSTGLPAGFSALWIEPSDTHLFLLGNVSGTPKLYKRPLSEFNLTPTTQFAVEPKIAFKALNVGDSLQIPSFARGQNVTYQWLRNGSPIPGQTNPTLNIPSVTAADAGTITIEVTGTDRTITNSTALTLKIVPATAGNHDTSFGQTPDARSGTSIVLNDFKVVQADGNFLALFGPEGGELARRVNAHDGLLRKGFVDTSGKLVIFGEYMMVRLNPNDLSDDPTFPPAVFATSGALRLYDVLELPGRGYLVATEKGTFFNGTEIPILALIRYDGTYDPSFTLGLTNFTSDHPRAKQLSLDASGRILVSGTFSRWPDGFNNGHEAQSIVRLNPDGTRDFSYLFNALNPTSAKTLPDGRVIGTGSSGNSLRIFRTTTTGALDTTFNSSATLFNQNILDYFVEPSGKVIVVGDFENFGGSPTIGYARLNADGTHDTTFDSTAGYRNFATNKDIVSASYDPRGYVYLIQESVVVGPFRENNQTGLVRVFTDTPALYLWRQSLAQKVTPGSPLTLSAQVAGTSAISYQWYKNGLLIPGETASSLTFGSYTTDQAGRYTVTATNASGSVTSSVMDVTTVGAPIINSISNDMDLILGGSLNLTALVEGAPTITYQWRKNGTPLPGKTSAILNIAAVTLADAGTYTLVATNTLGSRTSNPVIITVNEVTGLAKSGVTPYNVNGDVNTITILPDKSYIVGGSFTNPSVHRNLTRLMPNGSLATGAWSDSTTGGPNNIVRASALSRDGTKIYIGGDFTAIGSTPIKYVARLNLDGTIDSTFTPYNFTFISRVFTLAEMPNGQLMIGGFISQIGSPTRSHIARLNPDGSLDETFTAYTSDQINTLKILPDGSVLIGGLFTQANGVTARSIAKLTSTGSLDPTFTPPTLNFAIQSIETQTDGKILIGGLFTNLVIGGNTYNYLARLNPNGTGDSTFAIPNIPISFGTTVNAIHIQTDNRIVVGGAFSFPGGTDSGTSLQRLLPTGEVDNYFRPANGTNNVVFDIDSTPDGCLYLGGRFTRAGNATANRSAILTTTSTDLAISTHPADQIADLGGSATFSVGFYSKTTATFQWLKNGVPIPGETSATLTVSPITRASADLYSVTITNDTGSATSAEARLTVLAEPEILASPTSAELSLGGTLTLNTEVIGAATLSYQWYFNGALLPGATDATLTIPNLEFTNSGCYHVVVTNALGNATSHVASVVVQETPGSLDSFSIPGNANNSITSVAVLPNGNIAVGGNFTQIGGVSRTRFAVLDPNGNVLSLPNNFAYNNAILSLSAQADGKIIYAGLSGWGRINADGSADTTFPSSSFSAASCLVNGDDVYIGGYAGTYSVRKYSASTGLEDASFVTNAAGAGGVGDKYIQTLALLPNGSLACGSNDGRLAVLQPNGTPDPTFTNPISSSSSNQILDVIPAPGGKLYAIGTFTNVSGTGKNYIVRLNPDGSVDPGFTYTANFSGVTRGFISGNGMLIFGDFNSTINGMTYNGIARLNGDGSVDPGVGPFTARKGVEDIAIDSEGRIVFVGKFLSVIGRLTVESSQPFAFTCQPVTSPSGTESTTLSVGWSGGGPGSYQWQKNGSDIIGATGQTYLPTEPGDYRVIVTTPAGIFPSSAATIGPDSDPLNDYLAGFGVPVDQRGPNDDPDGDGFSNLLEFIYDANPTVSGFVANYGSDDVSGGAFITGAGLDPAKRFYIATLKFPKNTKGYDVTPHATTNPANFSDGSAQIIPYGDPIDDGDCIVQNYYMLPDTATSSKMFWRLEVTK